MIQGTNGALRIAGSANIPTEMYKPVAQAGLLLGFDDLFQGHLHFVGILSAVLCG